MQHFESLQEPPVDPSIDPMLRRVRFVLVETSHAGNVGSAARALKTMGFARLALVRPQAASWRSDAQALALATHAGDVLARAESHESLESALQGVTLAMAMSGYARQYGPVLKPLREAAAGAAAELRAQPTAELAFVFGTERSGLSNEDVTRCQVCCAIPSDGRFGSLNLAQAVQVAAYECRLALADRDALAPEQNPFDAEPAADVVALESMYAHLERALLSVGFLDPAAPGNLMARMRRLFGRARPTPSEIAILRGIFSALEQPKRDRIGSKRGAGGHQSEGG
jgi:tRNA/rRNA methyltransferase